MVAAFHFDAGELIPLGSDREVVAVAVGDVSGDRRDDVIVATSGTGTPQIGFQYKVLVFRQSPAGALLPYDEIAYQGSQLGADVALGDMDGDGTDDIVVGHGAGVSVVLYRRGTDAVVRLYRGDECLHMGVIDADLDGHLDIVCHDGGGWLTFWYGDGLGGIARSSRIIRSDSYGWQDLKIADVTGDGLDDIVLFQDFTTAALWVFPHKAGGGFAAPVLYPFPSLDGGSPWGLATGDFNDDGRTDVAVASGQSPASYSFDLMLQTTTGRFGPRETHAAYDFPGELVAADFDGNGGDDIVVRYPGWFLFGFFAQTPAGVDTGIKVPSQQLGGVPNNEIAVGDIDGNRCPDLAIVDGAWLGLYRGRGCKTKPVRTGGPSPKHRAG